MREQYEIKGIYTSDSLVVVNVILININNKFFFMKELNREIFSNKEINNFMNEYDGFSHLDFHTKEQLEKYIDFEKIGYLGKLKDKQFNRILDSIDELKKWDSEYM